jgi:anti-sigma regulatory factor (Ser/Thr protein kinase)
MTAGSATQLSSSLEFAPLPTAVPCARLHTVHVLHEWGLRTLGDDAALIVSELMTNAVDASVVLPERPPVALRLLASERSLLIEVWDQSPLGVEPREADADAECGRGLTSSPPSPTAGAASVPATGGRSYGPSLPCDHQPG